MIIKTHARKTGTGFSNAIDKDHKKHSWTKCSGPENRTAGATSVVSFKDGKNSFYSGLRTHCNTNFNSPFKYSDPMFSSSAQYPSGQKQEVNNRKNGTSLPNSKHGKVGIILKQTNDISISCATYRSDDKQNLERYPSISLKSDVLQTAESHISENYVGGQSATRQSQDPVLNQPSCSGRLSRDPEFQSNSKDNDSLSHSEHPDSQSQSEDTETQNPSINAPVEGTPIDPVDSTPKDPCKDSTKDSEPCESLKGSTETSRYTKRSPYEYINIWPTSQGSSVLSEKEIPFKNSSNTQEWKAPSERPQSEAKSKNIEPQSHSESLEANNPSEKPDSNTSVRKSYLPLQTSSKKIKSQNSSKRPETQTPSKTPGSQSQSPARNSDSQDPSEDPVPRAPKGFMQNIPLVKSISSRGYRLGPRVGKGSYAKVKLVERIADNQILAAKIVNRKRSPKEFLDKFLPRELGVLLSLNHPNVIAVLEVIQTDEVVCVFMEYATKGDLLDYVKRRVCLREEEAGAIFAQVCEGVSYLHDRLICHRDLKCENVLLRKDLSVALTDFGFARVLPDSSTLSSTYCGSTAYASPELLRGRPYDTFLNDVWSMGCVLFIMVTGHMPFFDKNAKKMMYRQLKGTVKYPENREISDLCKDMVSHMLDPNTSLRYSVDDLKKHEWLLPFQSLLREPGSPGSSVDVDSRSKTALELRSKTKPISDVLAEPKTFERPSCSQAGTSDRRSPKSSNWSKSPSGGSDYTVDRDVANDEGPSISACDSDAESSRAADDTSLCRMPGKACIKSSGKSDRRCDESKGTLGKKTPSGSSIATLGSSSNALYCSTHECMKVNFTADDKLPTKKDKPVSANNSVAGTSSTKAETESDANFKLTIQKILHIPFRSPPSRSIKPRQSQCGPSSSNPGNFKKEAVAELTEGKAKQVTSPPTNRIPDAHHIQQKAHNQTPKIKPTSTSSSVSSTNDEKVLNNKQGSPATIQQTDKSKKNGTFLKTRFGSSSQSGKEDNNASRERSPKAQVQSSSGSASAARGRSTSPQDQATSRVRQDGLVTQIRRIFESRDASTLTSPGEREQKGKRS